MTIDINKYDGDIDYKIEKMILDFTEIISKRMKELNIDKKELAIKIGCSVATVTKILDGNRSYINLENILKIAFASMPSMFIYRDLYMF